MSDDASFDEPIAEQLLKAEQVAEYLHVSEQTIRNWTKDDEMGIPHFRLGSQIRYRRSEVDGWLESRRHATGRTSPKGDGNP